MHMNSARQHCTVGFMTTHTHTHTLSLSHTHTHTHTHIHTPTHPTHTFSLSHTHTHTHTLYRLLEEGSIVLLKNDECQM